MPTTLIEPGYQTYANELVMLGHGLALWQPAPLYNYNKIKIGDVGYIRRGRFHLLFSTTPSLGNREPDVDFPQDFIPLEPGPIAQDQPRMPGALHTEHIEQKGGGFSVTSDITCIDAGTTLHFESSGQKGAILLTKYQTFCEDAERLGIFKDYILRNYQSWVDFANRRGDGVTLNDILLVTGHDMTLDFAMLAFSSNSRQIGMEFKAGLSDVASASVSVWGTWRTTMSMHHNCGPQSRKPPVHHTLPSLTDGSFSGDESQPEYNQCVFLRGFRIQKRGGLIPTVIKAAAGPHDLGPGRRFDENRPPLGRESPEEPDEELTIVSENPPFIDPLGPLFHFIFENSTADVALLHDLDLHILLKLTGISTTEDMNTLISRLSPQIIDVGADGVACIKVRQTAVGTSQQMPPPSPHTLNDNTFSPHKGLPSNELVIPLLRDPDGSQLDDTPPHAAMHVVASGSSKTISIDSEPSTPSLHSTVSTSNTAPIIYDSNGALKAATIQALVDRLISSSNDFSKDSEFRKTFLTSYRAFSNAEEVFRLLHERFKAVSTSLHSEEQRANVCYSVLTVLQLWIEGDYLEAKDIHLLRRMKEFAVSIETFSPESTFRQEFYRRLMKLIDSKVAMLLDPFPPPTSSLRLGSKLRHSEISPEALALALTTLEGDHYREIISSDCIRWLEGIDNSKAGISSFMVKNKKLLYWAQKSILRPETQKQRIANLEFFLAVIMECRRLRNFSSACVITMGLAESFITGLKRTTRLDKRSSRILEEAKILISSDMNFQAYRKALHESGKPCIPWLSVHLHDLKITHRRHPPFIERGGSPDLINFHRYTHISHSISKALVYQYPPIQHSTSPNHAEILNVVNKQLCTLVDDDILHYWLQDRATKLDREEQAEYNSFRRERETVGLWSSPHTPKRPTTSHTSRPTLPPSIPTSPSDSSLGTPVSPLPKSSGNAGDGIFSLDLFDRKSDRCLDTRIVRPNNHPVALGGFSDVYEGFIGDKKVAIKTIKTLRPFSKSDTRIEQGKLFKRLWHEYVSWSRVSHPIVLQCLGFTYDFSPEPHDLPSLISPWMSNGAADVYIREHPETDRLKLLVAVAEGLSFLHHQEFPIIHGDLRAGNILISDSGSPCLSDFGLSRILGLEEMTSTDELAGPLRWMAPELLHDSPEAIVTCSSDVWAYGMTILEIMAGEIPYKEFKRPATVLFSVSRGQIPLRPDDAALTDEVWSICQKFWTTIPSQRPSISEVFVELSRLTL